MNTVCRMKSLRGHSPCEERSCNFGKMSARLCVLVFIHCTLVKNHPIIFPWFNAVKYVLELPHQCFMKLECLNLSGLRMALGTSFTTGSLLLCDKIELSRIQPRFSWSANLLEKLTKGLEHRHTHPLEARRIVKRLRVAHVEENHSYPSRESIVFRCEE